MEDEACTTYSANIDQMTLGHQFIVELFGESAAPKSVSTFFALFPLSSLICGRLNGCRLYPFLSSTRRYGWQIDPFGHSNVVHEQFGLMGFNATVLDRIQSGLKGELVGNKSREMMWQTSRSLGSSSEVDELAIVGFSACCRSQNCFSDGLGFTCFALDLYAHS